MSDIENSDSNDSAFRTSFEVIGGNNRKYEPKYAGNLGNMRLKEEKT